MILEEATKICELEMKKNGWILLPVDIAQELGEKVVISPGKNLLTVRSLKVHAEFEKRLLQEAKNGDRQMEVTVNYLIGHACEYPINPSGKFELSREQRKHIGLPKGGYVALFRVRGVLYLTSQDNWDEIEAEISP